jgi:hypothetical protein
MQVSWPPYLKYLARKSTSKLAAPGGPTREKSALQKLTPLNKKLRGPVEREKRFRMQVSWSPYLNYAVRKSTPKFAPLGRTYPAHLPESRFCKKVKGRPITLKLAQRVALGRRIEDRVFSPSGDLSSLSEKYLKLAGSREPTREQFPVQKVAPGIMQLWGPIELENRFRTQVKWSPCPSYSLRKSTSKLAAPGGPTRE